MTAAALDSSVEAARKATEWIVVNRATVALGLLALLLVLQTLRLAFVRARPRWRIARHRRLGARGERAARVFLQQEGYRIDEEQLVGRYSISVDGALQKVDLRADYLVSRGGKHYVAEVKSGATSGRIETASTRRQLLEYRIAFPVDGVLLVDMSRRRIVEIELLSAPSSTEPPRLSPFMLVGFCAALGAVALLLML